MRERLVVLLQMKQRRSEIVLDHSLARKITDDTIRFEAFREALARAFVITGLEFHHPDVDKQIRLILWIANPLENRLAPRIVFERHARLAESAEHRSDVI